jgi:hypothetical protein
MDKSLFVSDVILIILLTNIEIIITYNLGKQVDAAPIPVRPQSGAP